MWPNNNCNNNDDETSIVMRSGDRGARGGTHGLDNSELKE